MFKRSWCTCGRCDCTVCAEAGLNDTEASSALKLPWKRSRTEEQELKLWQKHWRHLRLRRNFINISWESCLWDKNVLVVYHRGLKMLHLPRKFQGTCSGRSGFLTNQEKRGKGHDVQKLIIALLVSRAQHAHILFSTEEVLRNVGVTTALPTQVAWAVAATSTPVHRNCPFFSGRAAGVRRDGYNLPKESCGLPFLCSARQSVHSRL